jgi:hypothetical protein
MSKTPNYCLASAYTIHLGLADSRVLPAGSYISPVQNKYLPRHVLDNPVWEIYGPEYVFCYTKYGFVPIPQNLIRER